jgi:hypothetical protein
MLDTGCGFLKVNKHWSKSWIILLWVENGVPSIIDFGINNNLDFWIYLA